MQCVLHGLVVDVFCLIECCLLGKGGDDDCDGEELDEVEKQRRKRDPARFVVCAYLDESGLKKAYDEVSDTYISQLAIPDFSHVGQVQNIHMRLSVCHAREGREFDSQIMFLFKFRNLSFGVGPQKWEIVSHSRT